MSTRLMRRLVVLTSFALAVTVLPVLPAAAATTACPDTIASSGFQDLGGLTADTIDAIDCVAYYGIAQGISATAFDPNAAVTRWQMALFLTRTAVDLGISLPSGVSQGFVDLGGLTSQTVTAINQLAQLGITTGTSATTYSPNNVVSRWQMALFLTRLYDEAGFTLPSGTSQGFTDISGFVASTQTAINQLVQIGVTTGTSATTYSPNDPVLRWQMALFLARELEAGKASPLVVSISPDTSASPTDETVTLSGTVLTPDGDPVANQYVDVFVGSLNSSGTCSLDTDATIGGGADAGSGTNCRIDTADPRTNSNGAFSIELAHDSTIETDTIYAWTGPIGTLFDDDVIRAKDSTSVQWTLSPDDLEAPGVLAEYEESSGFQAYLVDEDDEILPIPGQTIYFIVTRGTTEITTRTVSTNSSGIATLNYTGPDDPGVGDSATTVDTVRVLWDKDNDQNFDPDEIEILSTVTWDDELPRSDTAELTQSRDYSLEGQSHTVTITVEDKFGDGVSGAEVNFTVAGANVEAETRTTNSSGVASFSYTATDPGVDTIDAEVDIGANASIDIAFGSVDDLMHYVAEDGPDLPGLTDFDIIALETGSNRIIVVEAGTSNVYRLDYDSNDTFEIDGNPNRSLSQFETAASQIEDLPVVDGAGLIGVTTNPYDEDTADLSVWTLTTS